jgi:hypothetical protein
VSLAAQSDKPRRLRDDKTDGDSARGLVEGLSDATGFPSAALLMFTAVEDGEEERSQC